MIEGFLEYTNKQIECGCKVCNIQKQYNKNTYTSTEIKN